MKSRTFGILLAIVMCGFILGVDLADGAYKAGSAQGVLSFADGAAFMLKLPGRIISASAVIQFPVLAVFYFFVGMGIQRMWRWFHSKSATETTVSSRRSFLKAGVGVVATGAIGTSGYSLLVEPRWPEVTRRVFPVPDLPPELDGLRLVQLTDLHHGPWIPLEHLRQVIATANSLEPDLILLTGDYVHKSSAFIDPVAGLTKDLKPRIATLGVLGNHDWWENGPRMRQAMIASGVRMLDNTRCFLTPARSIVTESMSGLCLAGVGDLWEDRQDYAAALGNLPPRMPRLLLSHNPDVAEVSTLLDPQYRVDLMICGHTHGGQVRLPLLGTPIVPSRYGQKYASGLVRGPSCPVFISRGIGMAVLPVRFAVRPEIAVITLRRSASDQSHSQTNAAPPSSPNHSPLSFSMR